MILAEAMSRLAALGSEKMRQMNARNGAGGSQFGVKMGDIRNIAKEIKSDHKLALELWATGNIDAMFLATLIFRPKQLSSEEVEAMVGQATFTHVADWLVSYVVKLHPEKEALRQKWMTSGEVMQARAGWSLTHERISKDASCLDGGGLLDRIERELSGAPSPIQWTMNFCLIGIGVEFPEHRARAVAIGETLGIYSDYPCSKGCTSPFAPIAIKELVSRKSS